MKNSIFFPLVVYFIIVITISLYFYRTKKAEALSNYFIGERKLNGFLLAMTLVATYISASSFIGGPGAAYQYGLGWVFLSVIQVPTVLLSLSILGKKFAILAKKHNAVTLSDILYARYQSRSLIFIASFSLIIAFWGAMTAQLIGGARLLETTLGIRYELGLLVFTFITALYTAIGGFKASVINDSIQGIMMLIGALILFIAVIYAVNGIPNAMQTLQTINPQLLSPQGTDHFITAPLIISFWVLVCFGVVGLPHNALRCMTYKDSASVHKGIIFGTIILSILMLTMHLIGVLGRVIVPDLTTPDKIIPTLMITILPPFAAGIFLAAPLAAIMSTVNAQLLQTSSALIKDIFLRLAPRYETHPKLTLFSAIFTFLLGMSLIFTAWHPPKMIIWLNLISFGGLQIIFLWPLVLGLYWSKANATGALSAIIVGGVFYIILVIFKINIIGLMPIVPALILSLIAFIIGNVFQPPLTSRSINIKKEK